MPAPTILVVDDDAAVRDITALLLEQSGFRAIRAASAAEALALADGEAPDLLLTDFNMPGRNGLELAAEMARRFPGLPVVLMSAAAPEEFRPGARLSLLPKPFSSALLCATIRRALNAYGRSVEGRSPGPGSGCFSSFAIAASIVGQA